MLNEEESDVKEARRRELHLLSWKGSSAEQSHRNTEMMRTGVELGGWLWVKKRCRAEAQTQSAGQVRNLEEQS